MTLLKHSLATRLAQLLASLRIPNQLGKPCCQGRHIIRLNQQTATQSVEHFRKGAVAWLNNR